MDPIAGHAITRPTSSPRARAVIYFVYFVYLCCLVMPIETNRFWMDNDNDADTHRVIFMVWPTKRKSV